MCGKQQPEKCEKGKVPKTCSAEQIRECHGDAKKHDCEERPKKKCCAQ